MYKDYLSSSASLIALFPVYVFLAYTSREIVMLEPCFYLLYSVTVFNINVSLKTFIDDYAVCDKFEYKVQVIMEVLLYGYKYALYNTSVSLHCSFECQGQNKMDTLRIVIVLFVLLPYLIKTAISEFAVCVTK